MRKWGIVAQGIWVSKPRDESARTGGMIGRELRDKKCRLPVRARRQNYIFHVGRCSAWLDGRLCIGGKEVSRALSPGCIQGCERRRFECIQGQSSSMRSSRP